MLPLPKKSSAWMCALVLAGSPARADEEDIAVAIVYDTSGSMNELVKGKSGAKEPKHQIANRALAAVVTRLEQFVASSGRKVQAGLFTFRDKGAQEVVKLGPFNPGAFRATLSFLNKMSSGTPLGGAIRDATQALWKTKAGTRNVLVITDGENTVGPPPEALIPKLQDECLKNGLSVYYHFLAFDVDARVFAGVKKFGSTVVGAIDEAELHEKLIFILEEKILLEKE